MSKDMGREELLGYWKGILLFLASHGEIQTDERAIAITKLLEQSTESVQDTGQNPVNAEPGVDEEWEKEFEEIVEAEDLSPSNRSALALDMVKQLLTHISTSGNNMSDKRVVTRDELQELIYICGDIEGQLMPFKEVVDWFKDRDIEVTTKK